MIGIRFIRKLSATGFGTSNSKMAAAASSEHGFFDKAKTPHSDRLR